MRWLALALLPLSLCAFEEQPWFPTAFEIQSELKYLYQTYNKVDTKEGSLHYHARDSFITGRLGVNIYDLFDVQAEVQAADTRAHSFNFDHAALNIRYQLWDEIGNGNMVTGAIGITGIGAIKPAVRDLSSFHHGTTEGEITLAIGKELSCWDSWFIRYWIFGAIGCADMGSPWTRANAAFEYQFPMRNQFLRFFVNSLWGLGNSNLFSVNDFKGYGPYKHQSVDVGVRYTYQFPYCGAFNLEYARRIVAKNYPKQVDLVSVSLLYPFGP